MTKFFYVMLALSVLAACAAPAEPGKTVEATAVRDCPTGTRVCRKDGSTTGDAQSISGEALRDALGRTPTATPVPKGGGS